MPERKTVGQLMEEMRLKAGAQNYHGHEYMDLQRFAEDTRNMIIFDMTVRLLPGGAMSGRNPRPRNSRRTGTIPFGFWPTTFTCSASGKRTIHQKHRRKIPTPGLWKQSNERTMWAICWIFFWRILPMNKDCGLPNIIQKSPIWKGE